MGDMADDQHLDVDQDEVSVAEAARLTGLSERTIRRKIAANTLPARRITGKRYAIRRQDLSALVASPAELAVLADLASLAGLAHTELAELADLLAQLEGLAAQGEQVLRHLLPLLLQSERDSPPNLSPPHSAG